MDVGTDEGQTLALELGLNAPPAVFILRQGVTVEKFEAIQDLPAVGATIERLARLDVATLDAAAAEKQRAFIRERYGSTADARSCGLGACGPGGCGGSAPPQAIDPGNCDYASMAEKMGYSTEQVRQLATSCAHTCVLTAIYLCALHR